MVDYNWLITLCVLIIIFLYRVDMRVMLGINKQISFFRKWQRHRESVILNGNGIHPRSLVVGKVYWVSSLRKKYIGPAKYLGVDHIPYEGAPKLYIFKAPIKDMVFAFSKHDLTITEIE